MNRDLDLYERDIIVSALPELLTCNIEPYPFITLTKFFKKHDWKDIEVSHKDNVFKQ